MVREWWRKMSGKKSNARNTAQLAEIKRQQEEVRRRLALIELKLSVIAHRPPDAGSTANERG